MPGTGDRLTKLLSVCVLVGVTVTVAVTGALVKLVAVNEGILPVPLAANPMLVLLLVQANVVVAEGVATKLTADVAEPVQRA